MDHLKPLPLRSNMHSLSFNDEEAGGERVSFLQGHKAGKDAKVIFEFRTLRSKLNHSSAGRGIHQI